MSNGIKAVVFDWAGTMIDFGSCAPVEAMRAAFASEGIAVSDSEIRAPMGIAKREHVDVLLYAPKISETWHKKHGAAPSKIDGDRIYAALEPLMQQAATNHATLIPGAAELVRYLRSNSIKIGSCTGYTRAMMAGIIPKAAEQGYEPDCVVCAGETVSGRPSPLMLWKNLVSLGVWPAKACVKVDDAEVGIEEGLNAGCWTVGVAASGNGVGLDWNTYTALREDERRDRIAVAAASLKASGAHFVIDTVADLPKVLAQISNAT
jgi:phosphonoacetaldehyde hydrolase